MVGIQTTELSRAQFVRSVLTAPSHQTVQFNVLKVKLLQVKVPIDALRVLSLSMFIPQLNNAHPSQVVISR